MFTSFLRSIGVATMTTSQGQALIVFSMSRICSLE